MDKDLQSIQQVRDLVKAAKEAQQAFSAFSQGQVDAIVEAMAKACSPHLESLAKMAAEETGFGIWQDKVLKNALGSAITYGHIKDMKTIGVLKEDPSTGITEIAVPVGVVAALIPSTNPTSTTMYKALISVKAGNAIIISPHPGAKNCIQETFAILEQAALAAGAPKGLVQCVTIPTQEGTSALLQHPDIGIILATGGEAMVRAAYRSGNPALGVGPGNGPAFIERSANIPLAVKRIFDSKTFDNGTICASEQSIITEACIEQTVLSEVKKQGGYILSDKESDQVARFIMRANGTMNPKIVGRSAQTIANMAGIAIPPNTRVLISRQSKVEHSNPYTREKLCPILAFYVEDSWEAACKRCMELLYNEGTGHTMTIHSEDKSVIREFALKKPVSRLLVNTPGALGGVGATTNLDPALTLGCGAIGGSATSDNVNPMHLIDMRRVAYGQQELEDIRGQYPVPPGVMGYAIENKPSPQESFATTVTPEEIERITRAVIAQFKS